MAADSSINIGLEIEDSDAQAKGKKAGDDIAKGVEQGLKNVGKQADAATKDVEKSLKGAADTAKSSFSDVGSAAKNGFSDVGDAAKTAAGDASSAFENVPSDAKGAFSDVSSEAKSGFDGVADAANVAADATSDAFNGVGDEIKDELDGVDTKANGIFGTNIPASTAIAGAAVGVLASQILDIGKNAVNTGMEFDASMSQVAATMGVATDEVQDLRKFAQEMGETTAFSASQSADALNYMALAGYDAETSMRVLPTVLNLAAAGNMDLARASDMVTDAQSALGLSVEQAETMVDQMAKASSKTNTSVEQLGDAFLTVGGTAKNLKGGTQELAQMLGILADNGVKGSEGGTALRNVILSLSAPTDKAAAAIESLGLEVFDAEGNMRSMPEIMNDMNAAMSDMTQQDRTNVLNDIFNKVDLKSVNALLGTSADRFNEVGSAIDNAQGAAQQMAETQLDNLAGDVTLLQSATEGFYIAVSDALTPALRGLTQFGTNTLMPFLTEGVKNFDKMAPAVIAAATAIALMAGKGTAVKILSNAFDTLKTKVAGSAVAYNQMDAAQKRAAVSAKALSVSMKAITSVGLIAVFSALVEAAFMFADSMAKADERAKKFDSATQGLAKAASGATVTIDEETGAFKELEGAISAVDMDEVLDQHIKLAESMSDTYQEAATSKAILGDYADTIRALADKGNLSADEVAKLELAVEKVNDACGTSYEVVSDNGEAYYVMADGAKAATDEILKVIDAQVLQIQTEAAMKNYEDSYSQLIEDNRKLADAKAYLAQKEDELKQKTDEYTAAEERNSGANVKLHQEVINLESEVDSARKTVDEMSASQGELQSATNQSQERMELYKMAMADGADATIQAAAANDDFISGVHSVYGNVIDFTEALKEMGFTSDQIANMSQEDAQTLTKAWQSGYEDMKQSTDDVIKKVGGEFPAALANMSQEAYNAAYGTGKNAGLGFSSGLSQNAQTAVAAVINTVGMTQEEFDKAAEKYGIEGDDAAIAFAEAIAEKDGDVEAAVQVLVDASTSDLEAMHDKFYNSGVYAVEGLIDGVNYKADAAKTAFASLALDGTKALKEAGGEGSPWKTTYRSGVFAAQGLINGIKKQNKKAKKSGTELANAIVSGANKRISNLKGVYNLSIDYEIAFWRRIRNATKKGSDAWYQAQKNVIDAKKRKVEQSKKLDDKVISNANTWLERYKLTHNLSLKAEENFWKKKIKKVKKGGDAYYTALSKIKNIQSQIDSDTLSRAEKWLDHYQITHNVSLKSQENYWKKYLRRVKKGSDEYYTILAKIKDIRAQHKESQNQYYNDLISNAETKLERYKLTHNVSLKYEWNYWKKRIKQVKKGSDAYYSALAKVKEAEQAYYDGILANAETYLERRKLTSNVSLKYELNFWKKKLKQFKKGSDQYYSALAKVQEAEQNYYDGLVSSANTYLERRKLTTNVSLKYEWDYWKKKLKQFKKGSDQYYEVLANVKDAEQAYYDGIIENANNYVSRQQRLFDMTYAQERDYWAKVLKKVKKGSAQYQEAYDNWLEAKKNAAAEVADKNSDLLDAEQAFVDRLREIQNQLTADIQAAWDAYKEAVEERKQNILSDLNTFEIYRKKMTISGEKLIENIKSQVAATKDYEKAMKDLENRIGKGDLYDEIASMGMEGLRYAESLNSMTKEQLDEFTKLYKERNAIAQREATRESEDLLTETNATIKELNNQAAKDIKSAANELKSTAADLGTTLSKTVANMAKNVKASADSITSSINSAINSLKKLDNRVSTSSSTKAYVSRPSGEAIMPVPSVYNGREVIRDSNGGIQGVSLLSSDLYGATRQTENSLLKGMEALTIALKDSRTISGDTAFNQTNNFYNPVSTPDEFAREMRIQQHYGLAGKYINGRRR